MVKRAVEMEGTVTVSPPSHVSSQSDQLADANPCRVSMVLAW